MRSCSGHLLSVDGLLYVGVDCDHAVVQIAMFSHEYLGVPGHGNEDGVDAAAERSSEDVTDLQANLIMRLVAVNLF